jgi:hypothetical protein
MHQPSHIHTAHRSPARRLLALLLALLLSGCALQAAPTATPTDEPMPTDPAYTGIPPTRAPTVPPATTAPAPATAAPSAAPTAAGAAADEQNEHDDELAQLAAAQRPAHDRVALARALGGVPDAPRVARSTPLAVEPGHVRSFWVLDVVSEESYQVDAELRYAGPVVLMYVEQGANVDQAALNEAARTFETEIYPRTRALFGSEWQPGVDGDERIVVLNMGMMRGGVAGYFSPRDSVPQAVNRFSNEHEMFYMNIGAVPPGSTLYLDTLAHELQHMIHWHEQRSAPTWFNEGNSTLSQDLNGFVGHSFVALYLGRPDTQLTTWSETPRDSLAHYGAAHLFLRYIYSNYAGEAGLAPLVRADAGNQPHVLAALAREQHPAIEDFGDLFANWAVANLLDDPGLAAGQYGYAAAEGQHWLPRTVQPLVLEPGQQSDTVSQFGADYYALPAGPRTLTFRGNSSVQLVGALPRGRAAWWSGRGDDSIATLTHAFDLRGLEAATLTFESWYEIERGYDYAFVSVSTDGGTTWETLAGSHTTTDDPHGANVGHGLTGVSGTPGQPTSGEQRGQWVSETMDLTPYAGQEILLRFWQVSDEGFNAPGILLDTIRIAELGFADDVEAGAGAWQAEGFVRVDGELSQQWELRLVRTLADGSTQVERLDVTRNGEQVQAEATLAAGEQGVLVVAATTPHTTEPASYELEVR